MSQGIDKHIKTFKAGEIFFFEGTNGKEMYIIQSGSVSISKKVQNIQKEIAVLKVGEFFGEMSILLNEPRSATAKAIEDTNVILINSDTFNQMLKENGGIAVKMVQALAERIRNIDDRLQTMMEERIFIALIALIEDATLRGQKAPDGHIVLTDTIEDLARQSGLPIIKVDEVLKILAKSGFIRFDQNRIVLMNYKSFMEFKKTYVTRYRF